METPQHRALQTSKRVCAIDVANDGFIEFEEAMKTPQISVTPHLEQDRNSCYFACIENGSHEVGVAVFGIYPPTLSLYQYSDTALYSYTNSLLDLNCPTKVIVPMAVTRSPLVKLLSSQLPASKIVEIQRAKFSDTVGTNVLKELSSDSSAVFPHSLKNRYLCLSAASAVVQYVQNEGLIRLHPCSLNTAFRNLDGHLLVDPIAINTLSMLTAKKGSLFNLTTPKRRNCAPSLFNVIDRTVTTSGARFLRSTLAAPPTNKLLVNLRHEFVSELLGTPERADELQEALKELEDLDDVIGFMVRADGTRTSSFALEAVLKLDLNAKAIGGLHDVLARMSSALSVGLKNAIEESNFEEVGRIVGEFIESDPSKAGTSFMTDATPKMYCLKKGVVPMLDVTRMSYESTLNSIMGIADDLSRKYGFRLSIKYNKTRRFFIETKKSQVEAATSTFKSVKSPSGLSIPAEFLYVAEKSQTIQATTQELLVLNRRAEATEADAITIAAQYVQSRIDEIRSHVSSMYSISEVIGYVDMLLSFSRVAADSEYCRSHVSSSVSLEKGRHPILEKLLHDDTLSKIISKSTKEFVPTSVSITPAKPAVILNGVSMSGKTTLLHTIGLTAILSQSGSFVPAESASFPILKAIYTNSRGETAVEGCASTFQSEMREMAHIISQASKDSLILLDEPASSTCPEDGAALAWACLETILSKGAIVVATTHFKELAAFQLVYPAARVCQMMSVEADGGFDFLYQLGNESAVSDGYGIKIAQQYLPPQVIEQAKLAYDQITVSKTKKPAKGKHAMRALLQKLLSLRSSTMDDESLRNYLIGLRNRCRSERP